MTTPLTREDVEALLDEVVDAAFQASSGSSVVFRTAERAEAALLAHDAALRARLAEAEAFIAPMAADECQSPRTRGLALMACGGCWPCRAKQFLAPERPA